jgi:hypothetical protein
MKFAMACREGDIAAIHKLSERDPRLLTNTFRRKYQGQTILELAASDSLNTLQAVINLLEKREKGLALFLLLLHDSLEELFVVQKTLLAAKGVNVLIQLLSWIGPYLATLPESKGGMIFSDSTAYSQAAAWCSEHDELPKLKRLLSLQSDLTSTQVMTPTLAAQIMRIVTAEPPAVTTTREESNPEPENTSNSQTFSLKVQLN